MTKRRLVIHPVLFALYPVLSLYSHNIDQMQFTQILNSAGIVLAGTLVLFLLPGWIFRNFEKTGLIVSALVFVLLTHKHISQFAACFYISHIIVMLELAAIVLGALIVIFTRRDLAKITAAANILSSFMVVVALGSIAISLTGGGSSMKTNRYRPEMVKPALSAQEVSDLPDIYHIILDGYGRADILEQIYSHDNSEFLDRLRQLGFRVAEKSRSNYCQTLLSLSSVLNLTYLDTVSDRMGGDSRNRRLLMNMVKNSYVFDFLKQYGYTTMAFACGYSGIEIRNADYFLTSGWSLNEFDHTMINNSLVPKILNWFRYVNQYDVRRQEIRFAFDKLADLPEVGNPRFVFAPILAPHPPFVFGPEGEEIQYSRPFNYADGSHYMAQKGATPSEYIKKYRGQVEYISECILATLEKILSRPGNKPIIILQADHGPGALLLWEIPEYTYFKERLTIVNAYYLPDGGDTLIYDEITPVNTYRLIFNRYFGTDFDQLADKSYFTKWTEPYRFIDVTESIESDRPPRIALPEQ